jgi:hypothetical protein
MRADPGKHLRGLLYDLHQAGPSPSQPPPTVLLPGVNTDPSIAAYHESMRNMSIISALTRGVSSSSSSLRQSPFSIRSSGSASSLLRHYDSNTATSEDARATMITSSMMSPPLSSPSNSSRNAMTNSSSMISIMGRSPEPPSPPNNNEIETTNSHDTATSDSTTSSTGSAMTTSSSIINRRTLPQPPAPAQPSAPHSPNISNTDLTSNIVNNNSNDMIRLISDRDILYPTVAALLPRSKIEITSINRTGRSQSNVDGVVSEKMEDKLQQPRNKKTQRWSMDDLTLIFYRRNTIRIRNMNLNNNGPPPKPMIKTTSASASSLSPQEIEKQHGGDPSLHNNRRATKTETQSLRLLFPSPPKRTNSSRSDKTTSRIYGLTATPSSSLEEEDGSASVPSTVAETYTVDEQGVGDSYHHDLVVAAVPKDDGNDSDDEDYSSKKTKKNGKSLFTGRKKKSSSGSGSGSGNATTLRLSALNKSSNEYSIVNNDNDDDDNEKKQQGI